jgi:hypothetical protein
MATNFKLFGKSGKKIIWVGVGTLAALLPLLYKVFREYAPDDETLLPLHSVLGGVFGSWRNLTAFGFSDRFAPETGLDILGMSVMLSVPVIVFFMILGVITVIRRWRRGELNLFDRLCICVMANILFFGIEAVIFRFDANAFGFMIALGYWLLAWRGFVAFRGDYKRIANGLLAGALLLELGFIAGFSYQIEENSGGGSQYFGAALSRQWLVAKTLTAAHLANKDLEVKLEVESYKIDPTPLQTLITLALRSKNLPEVGKIKEARLLPARRGNGIDLILIP